MAWAQQDSALRPAVTGPTTCAPSVMCTTNTGCVTQTPAKSPSAPHARRICAPGATSDRAVRTTTAPSATASSRRYGALATASVTSRPSAQGMRGTVTRSSRSVESGSVAILTRCVGKGSGGGRHIRTSCENSASLPRPPAWVGGRPTLPCALPCEPGLQDAAAVPPVLRARRWRRFGLDSVTVDSKGDWGGRIEPPRPCLRPISRWCFPVVVGG
jgi:hypothetical protein